MSSRPDNEDPIRARIEQMCKSINLAKERDLYFYLQPIKNSDVTGVNIVVNGRQMLQFSSYSYLDLLGHPRIQAAATAAIKEFGTGTQGVRILSGTVQPHIKLEQTIARFVGAEDAMVLSSGYVTNLGVIASLLGRNDVVITDKLNHASIVDGCLLSRAKIVRFDHNNMESLEKALGKTARKAGKLVVVDAVFSMDGDIVPLPEIISLCLWWMKLTLSVF
jgi:8-amino-7-oxononanoate synthase